MKRFSFSKNKRLLRNSQFKAILVRKLSAHDELLTLYMAENDCPWPRLGVSVGKSCGGAVVRNRLKRLLKEAFRQNQDRIPPGFDYLLMISPKWSKKADSPAEAKKAAMQLKLQNVQSSFLNLVDKIRCSNNKMVK